MFVHKYARPSSLSRLKLAYNIKPESKFDI